jgi:4-amino-4-deoxy-L-arabinose transferase-like glycosyltransferase
VVFTALLAQEITAQGAKSPRLPWVAGLFVGFMGQLWQSSITVMSDTTALASATIGVWALVRYRRQIGYTNRLQFPWLALAAISISFAVLTRWAYALVAIPCTIYALWCLVRQNWRKAIMHSVSASILTLLVLWPISVPIRDFLVASHENAPRFIGDLYVYSWNPLTAFSRAHTTPDGILSYRFPNGIYYALAPAHRFYFTPLLAPLLLLGFWKIFHQGVIQDRILLLSWIAFIYLFHSGTPYQNFRFTLAYLPPIAILTAIGFDRLVRHIMPNYRWIPSLVLGLGLGWMTYGGWTLTHQLIEIKNNRLETMRWVESQLPQDAQLVTFDITFTFQHYSPIETQDIFFLDPQDLADLMDKGRPTYLLLNIDSLESQWVGKSPNKNYRWLREVPGLITLGKHGDYSLFKIKTSALSLSLWFKTLL